MACYKNKKKSLLMTEREQSERNLGSPNPPK